MKANRKIICENYTIELEYFLASHDEADEK